MGKSGSTALDFLVEAPAITAIDALTSRFASCLGDYGFTTFGVVHFATPGEPIALRPAFGRDPSDWSQRYARENFGASDPTVNVVFSTGMPFSWADVRSGDLTKAQDRVFAEAASSGLSTGFVVPVTGPYGEVSAVMMAGDRRGDPPVSDRAVLTALATVFASHGRSLTELADDAPTSTPLTRRESECLTWVAQGKTDWEIGEILGIRPRTVGTHIDNARGKLDVTSRSRAVFEAWRRGWLLVAPSHGFYGNHPIN